MSFIGHCDGFYLVGDVNLTSVKPVKRTDDNFQEECIRKMTFILENADRENKKVVFCGSLFKKDFDIPMFIAISGLFKKYRPIVLVSGSDINNKTGDLTSSNALRALSNSELVHLVNIGESIFLEIGETTVKIKNRCKISEVELNHDESDIEVDIIEDLDRQSRKNNKHYIFSTNRIFSNLYPEIEFLNRPIRMEDNLNDTPSFMDFNEDLFSIKVIPHAEHVFDPFMIDNEDMEHLYAQSEFVTNLKEAEERSRQKINSADFVTNELNGIFKERNSSSYVVNEIMSLISQK